MTDAQPGFSKTLAWGPHELYVRVQVEENPCPSWSPPKFLAGDYPKPGYYGLEDREKDDREKDDREKTGREIVERPSTSETDDFWTSYARDAPQFTAAPPRLVVKGDKTLDIGCETECYVDGGLVERILTLRGKCDICKKCATGPSAKMAIHSQCKIFLSLLF